MYPSPQSKGMSPTDETNLVKTTAKDKSGQERNSQCCGKPDDLRLKIFYGTQTGTSKVCKFL